MVSTNLSRLILQISRVACMDNLTLVDIDARREELISDIARIKDQLQKAQAEFHISGNYKDPLWYAKAKKALRHKSIEFNQLNLKRGKLKKQLNESKSKEFERIFLDTAKEVLSEEFFSKIWDLSHKKFSQINT